MHLERTLAQDTYLSFVVSMTLCCFILKYKTSRQLPGVYTLFPWYFFSCSYTCFQTILILPTHCKICNTAFERVSGREGFPIRGEGMATQTVVMVRGYKSLITVCGRIIFSKSSDNLYDRHCYPFSQTKKWGPDRLGNMPQMHLLPLYLENAQISRLTLQNSWFRFQFSLILSLLTLFK